MVFAKDRDVFCPSIICSCVSLFSSQDRSWKFSDLGFVKGEAAEGACCGRPVPVLPRYYYLNDVMVVMVR